MESSTSFLLKPVPEELFQIKGKIFSVINQKGGCGKTTTAINLGANLAQEGFQVLLIDLDPQMNATLGLGVRLEPTQKNVSHLFTDPSLAPTEIIHNLAIEHLSLIPGARALYSYAMELLGIKNWEYLLRSFLRPLRSFYHFILLDCPPALNALTVNALTASDDMIIPIQTHYFSLEGMKELFLTVQSVRERLNPRLGRGKILATIYDRRTKINQEMLQSIRDYFKDRVFESVIHNNVRLIESVMHGLPIGIYAPHSRGAQDYLSLCHELLRKEWQALSSAVLSTSISD